MADRSPRARRRLRAIARGAWLATLFGTAYGLVAWLGYAVSYAPTTGIAAWWPASGLSLGVLLRMRRRDWPAILVGLAVADAGYLLLRGVSPAVAAGFTLADLVEPVLGAALILRAVGPRPTLGRLEEVLAFTAFGGILAPTVATLVAMAAAQLGGPESLAPIARIGLSWWGSAVLGSLGFAPLVLTWPEHGPLRPPRERMLEAFVLGASLVLVSLSVYWLEARVAQVVALGVATFPLLAWAAVRFGPPGAARAAALLSIFAIWRTLETGGILGADDMRPVGYLQVVFAQAFYALATFTALVLAAVSTERGRSTRWQLLLGDAGAILTEPTAGGVRLHRLLRRMVPGLVDSALVWKRDESGGLRPKAAVDVAGREERLLALAELHPPEPPVSAVEPEPTPPWRGWMLVPIQLGSELLGILALRPVRRLGSLAGAEMVAVRALADRIAVAAATTRLQRQAEEQARHNEESLALLETALRNAPVGFAFLDRNLRFQRVNDTFARIGNEPASALPGQPLAQALPEVGPVLEPLLRQALAGQAVIGEELETPDSPGRHWLCSAYPVRIRGAEIVGAGLLLVDLTERIRAEEERTRLYREAQEAIRVRDDFLSIASHELKTPLTPLSARLQTLERRLDTGKPVDPSLVKKARRSLDRLSWLVNDLLDATRIEGARLTLHREPIRLEEVVASTADAFRAGHEDGKHRLYIDMPDIELWIGGDRQRLEQVVANLVDNAFKYSPAGGEVRVSLELRDGEAVLSVADQGIGIPQDSREHLFERFFRARNAASSFGGLGLGLYITRDIVERHGGRIWVESEVGRGSTFHVALPLLEAAGSDVSLH